MSAVIIPFFREWGRLSFVQIFALQTWFMVACFLMEVPTGAVADRFGRKVSVACGGFLLAAASLLYGSFPHLAVFVVAEGLFAVAITLISGADEALAYDSLLAQGRQAEASRIMARLEAAKLAGILAGALLGAVVASRFGVRWPMLLQAVPLGLSGLVALTLVEPARGRNEAAPGEGYLRLLSGGLHHFRSAPELAGARARPGRVRHRLLAGDLALPAPAREGRGAARAFGVVHAAMGLGQIALLSRVAWVERAVGGKARLVRLTAVVPALAMLGLAATTSVAASIALIVAAAAAGLGRPPLFSGPINRLIPRSDGRPSSRRSGGPDARGRDGLPGGGSDPRPLACRRPRVPGPARPGRGHLRRAPARLFEEPAPNTGLIFGAAVAGH